MGAEPWFREGKMGIAACQDVPVIRPQGHGIDIVLVAVVPLRERARVAVVPDEGTAEASVDQFFLLRCRTCPARPHRRHSGHEQLRIPIRDPGEVVLLVVGVADALDPRHARKLRIAEAIPGERVDRFVLAAGGGAMAPVCSSQSSIAIQAPQSESGCVGM